MRVICAGVTLLSAFFVTAILATRAESQSTDLTSTPSTTKTLGVQIVLPPLYESTVSSLGALATSAAAALKTFRSDARSLPVRGALSNTLFAAGHIATTISLDKENKDTTLGEISILCNPRQSYVNNSISLNYLNTLVQNINGVSHPAAAPTDIAGALKLLFASSGYAIADKVKVDPATTANLGVSALASCKSDLLDYAQHYYGAEMPQQPGSVLGGAAAPGGVDTFAFLGPVGTLVDTFLSILQPILIDASEIVDQARRQQAIQTALEQNEDKILATGEQLATAIDNYASASRHRLAGAFVEQLVIIREMPIDLNSVADCKNMLPTSRLPSGAPNAAFIGCWSAAWNKLQPQVEKLQTIGDNYDALADAGNVVAGKLFLTIMANYKATKDGKLQLSNTFFNEMTEFITFANDISKAVSSNNIAPLKSAVAAVSK